MLYSVRADIFNGGLAGKPDMDDLKGKTVTASYRPEPDKRRHTGYLSCLVFFLAGTVFLVLSVLLRNRAITDEYWLVNVYIPFSREISGKLSDFSAVFPFSLAELLVYMMLVCILVCLIIFLIRAIRRALKFKPVLLFFSVIYMAFFCVLFLFYALWGLNYYAPPVGEQIGLTEGPASKELLLETSLWLRDKMNEYANQVPRGEDDACLFGGPAEIAAEAANGFEKLAGVYPRFDGAYNVPKSILSWPVFSKSGIWGIYIPLTGESNVNPDVPDASLPFTICHEMSHRLAVAPEQETNFVAFLAGISSDYPMYRYSAYFSAFVYCYNAVAEAYPQELAGIAEGIDPYVTADFRELTEHSIKNEGSVREFASNVNDSYLKSMSQDDGVLSYGRVVDLIIAYYLSEISS